MFLTWDPFESSRIHSSLPPVQTLRQRGHGQGGDRESGSGFLQEQESIWHCLADEASSQVCIVLLENRVSEDPVVDKPGRRRERLFSLQIYVTASQA